MKTKTAIMYLRFSTDAQFDGDSERRQTQLADRWCKDEHVTLLKIFKDLGVSGGRSSDQRKGLSALMKSLALGNVPTYLLIEDVDRLSRQLPLDSLNLISKILDYGITIVSLRDGQTLTKNNWQSSQSFMILSLKTTLANEERQKRIFRGKLAWKQKRIDSPKKIYTRKVPAWLRVEGDKIVRIPEHVETVRRLFQLANDGIGIISIIRLFNKEGVPSFRGNDWNKAVIHNTLTNEAVLGHFQPKTYGQMRDEKGELLWQDKGKTVPKMGRVEDGEKILNYFPKIIEPTLFYAVQAKLKQRNKYRGAGFRYERKHTNIFAGLIKCEKCGASLINMVKSRHGNYHYLVCGNAHKHKQCEYKTVRTDILEEVFGTFLVAPNFAKVSKTFNEKPKAADGVRFELETVANQLNKYLKLIDESDAPPKSILQKIQDLEMKQAQLEKELQVKLVEDQQAAQRPQLFQQFCEEMHEGMKDTMGRARIASMMKDVIEKIIVNPAKCTMRIYWVEGLLSDKIDYLQWDTKTGEFWHLFPYIGEHDSSKPTHILWSATKEAA